MPPSLPGEAFLLTPIAETGDRFRDFAPYVISINDEGVVAFQAALKDGGAGIYRGNGGSITAVVESLESPFRDFISHPDINGSGVVCGYGDLKEGGQAVFLIRDGKVDFVADTQEVFASIGPLGPTMNETGMVAFRATFNSGEEGIFLGDGEEIVTIADTRGPFRGFQGLPVVNIAGRVVFRADLKTGGQGLYAGSGGPLDTLADTRSRFQEFGMFPSANDVGTTAFCAKLQEGGAGIFSVTAGIITTFVDTNSPFESFRSTLINNAGEIVFAATPYGGEMGIYAGLDADDRILSIGDSLFGSTVKFFVLNPVSVNDVDQIALRVELANGKQVLLRAERSRCPVDRAVNGPSGEPSANRSSTGIPGQSPRNMK